ncbi:MAG: PhzF family phenazine biosynthesis protein [Opitutaceae bacterium]|jgi:PhzF family phenazine biosynthesis protein|nr:PhzF family phenazine biosynthesis protein [Opitutaceae bacterium]
MNSAGIVLQVVDAFADRPFAGNPAAVCLLPGPAREDWMRRVAREMNLAETAFLHPREGGFSLRWFTPKAEVELCGHATLASAHALWETGVLRAEETASFHTLSGWLRCRRDDAWIEMDFPALPSRPVEIAPEALLAGLGARPVRMSTTGCRWLVELATEAEVRALAPDFGRLASLAPGRVVVTAPSADPRFDFVSRFFAPDLGVNEDPVTGSAHCALGPYWRQRLGRDAFTAYQASERGGVVRLAVSGDRVLLRGQAVTVSRVELTPAASADWSAG